MIVNFFLVSYISSQNKLSYLVFFYIIDLAKLKEGVNWEHILDFIREGEIIDDINQRILLLERQDLNNISRDFNINYVTRRHKNDAISVDLWVNEMKSQLEEDCPILYYKVQDKDYNFLEKKDFALIMTKQNKY